MIADHCWREYNIHGQADEDNEEEMLDHHHLFENDPADTLQDFTFEFGDSSFRVPTIVLAGHDEYHKSTGMAVWKGSEVLADYLVTHQNDIIRHKRVVELGAGLGLCGMVAYHLGASSVCWTDGDVQVLEQLRHNVARNTKSTTKNNAGVPQTACPQLIWGNHHQVQAFLKQYGPQDVVLATDCLYMAPSVEPFFQTVHKLLKPNGTLLYCNCCASQAPKDLIETMASKYQLESDASSFDDDRVYAFRRK